MYYVRNGFSLNWPSEYGGYLSFFVFSMHIPNSFPTPPPLLSVLLNWCFFSRDFRSFKTAECWDRNQNRSTSLSTIIFLTVFGLLVISLCSYAFIARFYVNFSYVCTSQTFLLQDPAKQQWVSREPVSNLSHISASNKVVRVFNCVPRHEDVWFKAVGNYSI